jgi:polar amino acid transport system substrate-binding protein
VRHISKGVFLLLVILMLAACGSSQTATEGSKDDGKESSESGLNLVEEGKFNFATSGEFKPFSVTNDDGTMTGFDVDVAEAVAKELGLEPVQHKFKFGGIVEGVKSGRFDAAVASHAITAERLEAVNFSTPYYYSGPQIFVRPDSTVETLDDLKDMEIAVSKGTTYTEDAQKVTNNIKFYDSDVVALEALSKGKHDAVITDFVTGKEAMGAGMEIAGKELLGRTEQAIAIGKDKEELLEKVNKALEKLRENGTLTEISNKYFGEDITVDPDKE